MADGEATQVPTTAKIQEVGHVRAVSLVDDRFDEDTTGLVLDGWTRIVPSGVQSGPVRVTTY